MTMNDYNTLKDAAKAAAGRAEGALAALSPAVLAARDGGRLDPSWRCEARFARAEGGAQYAELRAVSPTRCEILIERDSPHAQAEGRAWVVYGPEGGYLDAEALFDDAGALAAWLSKPACRSLRALGGIARVPSDSPQALVDAVLAEAWEELSDVAVDEDGALDAAWRGFEAGCPREECWADFDENHSGGVAALMFPTAPRVDLAPCAL